MPKRDAARAYGSDGYWMQRYARRHAAGGVVDDETDEWLLAWDQLQPLLAPLLPPHATVIDLGCGTSSLAFDLLRDHLTADGARLLALDVAPAAIEAQRAEQQRRVTHGERSALRCELACADAASPDALSGRSYDACIDKSTTDGLLCDARHGADRVRRIYSAVGAALSPTALVAVVSWRDPQDGVEWLVDLVLGGLRLAQNSGPADDGPLPVWTLDVHSVAGRGPHVYLLRRRPRRASARLRAARAQRTAREAVGGDGDADDDEEEEEELSMKHHIHDALAL